MYTVPAILPDSEIRAMQGAAISLGSKGIPVVCLSNDSRCLTFKSGLVKKKIISPPTAAGDVFIDFLVREVPRGVLYPSTDGCALLFSQHLERLTKEGFSLNLLPEKRLVEGFDKWKCYENAMAVDIPCPYSKLITCDDDVDEIKEKIGYPFIFKATRLAGGNYIKVNHRDEVSTAYENIKKLINNEENRFLNPKLIAQRWLEYDMEDIWCSESYYNKSHSPVGFLTIRKDRTVVYPDGSYGSRLYAGECVHNDELSKLTEKLLNSLSWKGFAHLDWIYSKEERKFYLMEINPRLPGFSILPYKVGFDMAYYYYCDMLDINIEKGNIEYSTLYFEALRYPGDISSSLSLIVKRKYGALKFFKSYFRGIFNKKKTIIDLFVIEDKKITIFNFILISKMILSEIFHIKK
jgi:predicted ATP-grasp superfamily ATP-dependent carboligase